MLGVSILHFYRVHSIIIRLGSNLLLKKNPLSFLTRDVHASPNDPYTTFMCALNYCPFLKSTFLVFLIHIGHSNSTVHHLTTIKKQSSPFERLTKLYFYKYLNRKDIFPFPLERQSAGVSYVCSQVGKYFQGLFFYFS